MSRLDASLDDIIKSESKRRGGGGGGGGGAIRSKGGNGKSRATPYGRPANGRSSSGSKGGGGPGGGGDDTSVHVSNLPFDASWRDIKEHLLTAGDVLRVEVASRPDGSSRGHATATFETVRGARAAIATLHESEFMGRRIAVREHRNEAGGRGGKGGKGGKRWSGGGKGGDGRGHNWVTDDGSLDGPDDGYTYSGSKGKNGWTKPDPSKFVDKGPPPDPKLNLER